MSGKKTFQEVALQDIRWQLEGTVENAIKYLQSIAKDYGADALIGIGEEGVEYSYPDKEYAYVRISVRREETDAEYAARIAQEKEHVRNQRLRDEAELKRLKEKLEGKHA